MKKRLNGQSGVAMILVLIAIIIIVGALALVSQMMTSATHNTDKIASIHRVEEACKGGIDFAVERLWNQYLVGNGNTTGNLASYRYFIDAIVPENSSIDLLEDGPLVVDPDLGVVVNSITIERTDDVNGILLAIQALGENAGTRQRVEQTIRISGEPFSGYEYCVLANNINCILCHANFYSLPQQTNTDSDLYGSFDRVKVATLEMLMYRTGVWSGYGTADSQIAGSIYTRGDVIDELSRSMSMAQIASSSLKGYAFSDTDGKLYEDPHGDAVSRLDGPVSLFSSGLDSDGNPIPFDSIYKDYPTDPDKMTDGPLPNSFPAPYPDNDGNRYIEDSEFEEIASVLEGSISGGIAYGVPEGDIYDQPSLPVASNSAMADLTANGRYDGNVVLVGTDANPIVLDGDVAIDGDLVIQGTIKGTGQVFVRGNTYVTGDVTYADAAGEFGVASDGTENAFGLVSGGSVLIGDYITTRMKSWPSSGSGNYYVQCRDEHNELTRTSRQRVITGYDRRGRPIYGYEYVTESLYNGYFDPGVIDPGEEQATMLDLDGNEIPRDGTAFSFTQSELQLFNNIELQKALDDPNYVPRFYGLRETQPDNIYLFTNTSAEHAMDYKTNGVELLADYLIRTGVDPSSILDRAAFHYMNPENYWMDYDALRQIWWDDEMSHSSRSGYKFDGLIYSNNAIFAVAKMYNNNGSYREGSMTVRGAFVCPDLGVLAPGYGVYAGQDSFTMMYDPRVRDFWAPTDTTKTLFERVAFRILPVS